MRLTAPRLTYDIIPEPFPLLASAESGNPNKAKLTALGTNRTGSDVVLQAIILQLPVGSGHDELTLDPAAIGHIVPPNWSLASKQTPRGFVKYIFQPNAGFGTLPKGHSLAFVLTNIEVNRKYGSFLLELTEGSGECEPQDCPVYSTHLTKFPNGWGHVSFWGRPANIPYKGTTTLNWNGPAGATYTIDYLSNGRVVGIPRPGKPPLANEGKYPGSDDPPLSLDATTVFTLNVSQRIDNEEFEAQEQVAVSVGPPPPKKPKIQKFKGLVALDGSQLQLTLSWITEGADEVTITHLDGLQKRTGEIAIRPRPGDTLHTTYTLEASTDQEAVTSTVSIMWIAAQKVGEPGTSCALLPDGSRLFLADLPRCLVRSLDPVQLVNVPGSPYQVRSPSGIVPSPDSNRVYLKQSGDRTPEQIIGYDSHDFRL